MSQQINLYNPLFRKQKNYLTAPLMAAILGVVLLGVIVASIQARMELAAVQRQAEAVHAEVAAAETRRNAIVGQPAAPQQSATLALDLARAENDHAALENVSQMLTSGKFGNARGYSPYFRALGRRRIDGLWLTAVSISGLNNDIGLKGRTVKAELVPELIAVLGREPVLQGKAFGHLEMSRPAPVATVAGAPVNPPVVVAASLPFGPGTAGLAASPPAVVPTASAAPLAPAAAMPASYLDFSLQGVALAPSTMAARP